LSTRQLVTEITGLVQQQQGGVGAVGMMLDDYRPDEANLVGISYSVPPAAEKLLAGMNPQIVMSYANDSHLIHRDIYRIICHAVETTVSSSSDKERLAALWRDLLRVFFNLPVQYMYSTSPAPLSAIDDPSHQLHPSEAWAPGTKVITMYGRAEILSFRPTDCMYCIQLPFGVAFVTPTAIFGAEQLSANALYVIGVTPAAATEQQQLQQQSLLGEDSVGGKSGKSGDVIFNGLVQSDPDPSSSSSSSSCNQQLHSLNQQSKLFYGTQMCYIFMRLHHTMYVRLRIARQLSLDAQQSPLGSAFPPSYSETGTGDPTTMAVADAIDAPGALFRDPMRSQQSNYGSFMGQVFALVEGTIDNARYEEFCRTWLGNSSYILYTLDKIVAQTVKHLQAMANDEHVNKLIGLFLYHRGVGETSSSSSSSGGSLIVTTKTKTTIATKTKGVDVSLYRNHVSMILSHTMEEVYRIQVMTPMMI